ncbi:alpha-galactosidase [Rathayibacter sp. Leaf299]|uniref:alpha-galactosidase n=1 Tax=Rathayibacter sp. Leaf299 TaxID=1736328 RepID=UPI0006F329A7|nr:alpha-galactosidase [Rathayibacter sp. Leaf299]KQQ22426.1 alpha-galactosidase [Rathayibacter sp. Leaf299]
MSVRMLRSAGTALIVALRDEGLPEIMHWGRDPGPVDPDALAALDAASVRQVPSSALDAPWPQTILPGEQDGWQGRPGLAGHIAGEPLLPSWRVVSLESDERCLVLEAVADELALSSSFHFDDAGVLVVAHALANRGERVLEPSILEATLPLDARAVEFLDLSGRWTRERSPQRRPVSHGSIVRESRRGRTGHDAPTLAIAGTAGFGDRSGEVWGVHLAWSSDSVHRVDRLPEGRGALGAGELLRAGEIALGPGERFEAPAAHFVWSDAGLDGLSRRLHASLRARPSHPRTPRPVHLNTWEAVYFRHDLPTLIRLADAAAEIGVERFVLDDGWFDGRRDDSAGLGDWTVDAEVWPEGLHPLVEHVRGAGMQFGLWVEPEMISPGSRLAREHPDWLLESPRRARSWRNQHVLDVARPEVSALLLERLSALVEEYAIDYLKWDHNRDLLEAVHAGRAGADAQTRAVYALLDALRERHPGLEIESCASGGARVDLGILARTDRVWASDTNDPLERLRIQRWTELLLPPELIGSHVGPERAHTTGRTAELAFRMATTLFSSPGIETDITGCSAQERTALAAWIRFYKCIRPLLATAELVHGDTADDGSELTGAVSPDRRHAVYRLARSSTGEDAVPPATRLVGLDPSLRYRVRVVDELAPERFLDAVPPEWTRRGEVVLPGSLLAEVGLRTPLLAPSSALVLEVEALDGC